MKWTTCSYCHLPVKAQSRNRPATKLLMEWPIWVFEQTRDHMHPPCYLRKCFEDIEAHFYHVQQTMMRWRFYGREFEEQKQQQQRKNDDERLLFSEAERVRTWTLAPSRFLLATICGEDGLTEEEFLWFLFNQNWVIELEPCAISCGPDFKSLLDDENESAPIVK